MEIDAHCGRLKNGRHKFLHHFQESHFQTKGKYCAVESSSQSQDFLRWEGHRHTYLWESVANVFQISDTGK